VTIPSYFFVSGLLVYFYEVAIYYVDRQHVRQVL